MANDGYDYRRLFYQIQQETTHPPIVEAIVRRMNIYIAEVLYKDLYASDTQAALDKILISDVEAGGSTSLGDAIDYFNSINHLYPFTAYNVTDPNPIFDNRHTVAAANGSIYCDELGAKIKTYPSEFNISFTTFYNSALDYQTGLTIIGGEEATLTRLYAPIYLGTTETLIPFDVNIEIAKGSYAYQFEEYLNMNKIWDLVHNIRISFFELFLDTDNIFQVDDMVFSLGDSSFAIDGDFVNSVSLPDAPIVVEGSTVPVDGQTEVVVGTQIELAFSEVMIFDTLDYSILPDPGDVDILWDTSCKVVTIQPRNDLQNATEYIFTLNNIQSVENIDLAEPKPVVITFFTEA